jgi:hypothetical protein
VITGADVERLGQGLSQGGGKTALAGAAVIVLGVLTVQPEVIAAGAAMSLSGGLTQAGGDVLKVAANPTVGFQ